MRIQSLIAALVTLLCAGQALAAPETFLEYCEQLEELPEEQRKTVQAVVDRVKVPFQWPPEELNCELANQRVLANKSLTIFDRSNTFLPPAENLGDLTPLATLTHLEELHIGGAFRQPQRFDLTPLLALTKLRNLTLNFQSVAGFDELAALPALEKLSTSLTALGDISGFQSLRDLTLELNRIGRVTLEKVNAAPQLEGLQLTANGSIPGVQPGFGSQTIDLAELRDLAALQRLRVYSLKVEGSELLAQHSKLLRLEFSAVEATSIVPPVSLKELLLSNVKLDSFAGLALAKHATKVSISYSGLDSLDPFATMTKLEELRIPHNEVRDVAVVTYWPKLRVFEANNNEIYAATPLSSATELEELDLSNNRVTSIYGLKTLTKLKQVRLTSNGLRSLDGLNGSAGLEVLEASGNTLFSIEAIRNHRTLREVSLASNRLSSTEVLGTIPSLHGATRLDLRGNKLSDLTGLEKFTELQTLSLYDNAVTDITALQGLNKLERLGLAYNSIEDVSALDQKDTIKWLDLGNNKVSNVEALATLTGLEHLLNLDSNQVTDISPLKKLRGQRFRLILKNNPLTDRTCPIEHYCEF